VDTPVQGPGTAPDPAERGGAAEPAWFGGLFQPQPSILPMLPAPPRTPGVLRRTTRHTWPGFCLEEDVVVADASAWPDAPEASDPTYAVACGSGLVYASRARVSRA